MSVHVCPCLIGPAGCVLCVIGGAVIDTTNKQSVADLSRNDEGVVKNYFCIPKQLEIRNSLVSLFGGHIVLFLSTETCVQDNADAVLRRRHLPHPSVLHGHGPRHAETRLVSRVQSWPRFLRIPILKLGLLLISASDTADSPLDLLPPPLCLPFPLFRHVSDV